MGFDLLKELGAVWDFRNDEIQLAGVVHKLCNKEKTGWCRRVILQSDCVVPSRSDVVLPTKVVYGDLTQTRSGGEPKWITEAQQLRCGLQAVSYTHLRAHETDSYLVCRLLLEKKK